MILNIFLIIVVVVLVAKNRATSPSLPVPPNNAVNEGGRGNQGTVDINIEMNQNSLYGLTTDGIVTEPSGVSVSSQSAMYEYVIP